MVDTALPHPQPAVRGAYVVERLTDPEAIRSLLEPERAYSAYAIAQLDPGAFSRSEWWTARGPSGWALVLHSRGGLGQALFVLGDAEALEAILRLHPGPRIAFASLRPEHRQTVARHFHLLRDQLMLRMVVEGEYFRPVEGEAVRLGGGDISRINRLYSTEGGPAFYTPRHIDEGVYYGVFRDGMLVSIAGTHVVAPSQGVALVGNVFTHPLYRGMGLAAIATSAVTQALLRSCPMVALTVEATNEPAVRVYRRLGYRQEGHLYETPAVRREPTGLLSLARRLAAAWRGRARGEEIVIR